MINAYTGLKIPVNLRYLHTPAFFGGWTAVVPPPPVKWWRMKNNKSIRFHIFSLSALRSNGERVGVRCSSLFHHLQSAILRLRLRWPVRPSLVRQFGRARLFKMSNGEHQLIGGSDADRAAAFEWVSLFAHEIVFTHFHREPTSLAGRVALRPPFSSVGPSPVALPLSPRAVPSIFPWKLGVEC